MHPRELFEANLGTIERVIAIVCRRGGLFGADAEDFARHDLIYEAGPERMARAWSEGDFPAVARY